MAGTVQLADGCPRCAGEVNEHRRSSAGDWCSCVDCGATWGSFRDFERECVARDLIGNRQVRKTPEWLKGSVEEEDSLARELQELVYIARHQVWEEVLQAVELSIKAREGMSYSAAQEKEVYSEIAALKKMRDWVLSQTEVEGRKRI